MATEQERSMMNSLHTGNTDYNNFTSLQIRLNTEPILRQLEMSLRGYEERMDIDENNMPILKFEKTGEAKANERGIQAIMGRAQTILNPQVVQGNFSEEEYNLYLYRVRVNVSTDLMINLHRYNIKVTDYNAIVNMFMSAIEAFMSRLKDNKERESYASTIRSIESSSSSIKGAGLQMPFMTR